MKYNEMQFLLDPYYVLDMNSVFKVLDAAQDKLIFRNHCVTPSL